MQINRQALSDQQIKCTIIIISIHLLVENRHSI